MNVKHALIVGIFFLTLKSNAQILSKEFGKLGKAETMMTEYQPDKSASAIILFDFGKSRFVNTGGDFEVIFEKTTRIKILTKAGIKWADIVIPFYQQGGNYEEIYDLEAYTYNPSGETFTRTALDLSTCYDEEINEYWNVKKFAFPDVKPGSICEYRYKLRSQNKFNLRGWNFQSLIPTLYSEYEVRMIPFYSYTWLLQGSDKFKSHVSRKDDSKTRYFGPIKYKDMIDIFSMSDIPAFNDEAYISSVNDYIIKLDFQLVQINHPNGTVSKIVPTWPDLIKELIKDENVVKYAKKCEKLAAKFINPDSIAGKSKTEKLNYILTYIKANYNWDKSESKYSSKSPSDLAIDKFGNSSDLNLLAVGLLNAAGVEAYPLILSTRENGRIKVDYPLLKALNYVLICASIDGQNVLADATDIFCPDYMIPFRCLNDKGLLIKQGTLQWIPLQQVAISEVSTTLVFDSLAFNPLAKIEVNLSNYDAMRYRDTYGDNKDKIVEKESNDNFQIEKSSLMIQNPFSRNLPYDLSYIAHFAAESMNNKMYIAPFLSNVISDNPLKMNARTYPIDFSFPVIREFSSTINIPQGYKPEYIPKDEKIGNEMFELNYSIISSDQTIQVKFAYSFRKAVYPASEYKNLQYYFNEIIKKGNEKIVFVKVT
jgi:transglutaminase-like putative cysteine protease